MSPGVLATPSYRERQEKDWSHSRTMTGSLTSTEPMSNQDCQCMYKAKHAPLSSHSSLSHSVLLKWEIPVVMAEIQQEGF